MSFNPERIYALLTKVGGTGVLSLDTAKDDFVIKLIWKVGIQTFFVFQASVSFVSNKSNFGSVVLSRFSIFTCALIDSEMSKNSLVRIFKWFQYWKEKHHKACQNTHIFTKFTILYQYQR